MVRQLEDLRRCGVGAPPRDGDSSRGPGGMLSNPYLEDGVVSVLAGAMPGGMAPRDVEEFPFPVDPLKPWVLAAVHLGHQPGLQPHPAGWWGSPRGWLVHGRGVCRRKQEGAQQISSWTLPAPGGGSPEGQTVSPLHPGVRGQFSFPNPAFLSQSVSLCFVSGGKGRK